MPLEKGSSREVISRNVEEMVRAGHPQKQAVAAAYRSAGKSRSEDTRATVDAFLARVRKRPTRDDQDPPYQAMAEAVMKKLGGTPPSRAQVQDTFRRVLNRDWRPPPSDHTPIRPGVDANAKPPVNPAAEQLARAATSHNAAARAHSKAAEVHTQAAARFGGGPRPAAVTRPTTGRSPRDILARRLQARPTHDGAREAPPMRPDGEGSLSGWVISGSTRATARAAFSDAIRRGASFADAAMAMRKAVRRHVGDEHVGFAKLKAKLAHKKGITDPGGLAYTIGKRKFGKKEMTEKAEEGR